MVIPRFNEVNSAVSMYNHENSTVLDMFSNLGLKCIFAPISGINLSIYNGQNDSNVYMHHQLSLNDAIQSANNVIVEINGNRSLATPWTSRTVFFFL